jgi:hypothetical protein
MKNNNDLKQRLQKICKVKNQKIGSKIEAIADVFFKEVMGCNTVIITDNTTFDFFINPQYFPENAVGKGLTEGYLQFMRENPQNYVGPYPKTMETVRDPKNWTPLQGTYYIDAKPSLKKEEIISKTLEVFGVDISEFINGSVNRAVLHIVENCNNDF